MCNPNQNAVWGFHTPLCPNDIEDPVMFHSIVIIDDDWSVYVTSTKYRLISLERLSLHDYRTDNKCVQALGAL